MKNASVAGGKKEENMKKNPLNKTSSSKLIKQTNRLMLQIKSTI